MSEQALRLARKERDWQARAALSQGLGSAHRQLGRLRECASLLEEGLVRWDRAGERPRHHRYLAPPVPDTPEPIRNQL